MANTSTLIYSQPSIEALENLINSFVTTFGFTETIDDMFYYGVFHKPQNYANYKFDNSEGYSFEIPPIIASVCASEHDKIEYVKSVIKQVIHKEIEKPEWMCYIELNDVCEGCGGAPSTFLTIEPKEEEYADLAEKLIEFLYSPNLVITMLDA